MHLVDLGAGLALVVAVVELAQQGCDARIGEARDRGCTARAFHGAGVDGVKVDAGQPLSKRGGLCLAGRCQGKVGAAGMAAGAAPLGLAVAGEVDGDRQAGLPIISGRPDRSERLALSITAPARTRWPGRTQTRPTAARPPAPLSASLTAASTRVAACAVPATSVSGRIARSCGGVRLRTPGVSTSRTVPASAAAIVFSVSSMEPDSGASMSSTPRLRWYR